MMTYKVWFTDGTWQTFVDNAYYSVSGKVGDTIIYQYKTIKEVGIGERIFGKEVSAIEPYNNFTSAI